VVRQIFADLREVERGRMFRLLRIVRLAIPPNPRSYGDTMSYVL